MRPILSQMSARYFLKCYKTLHFYNFTVTVSRLAASPTQTAPGRPDAYVSGNAILISWPKMKKSDKSGEFDVYTLRTNSKRISDYKTGTHTESFETCDKQNHCKDKFYKIIIFCSLYCTLQQNKKLIETRMKSLEFFIFLLKHFY